MATTATEYWYYKKTELLSQLPELVNDYYIMPLEIKQSVRTQVEYCRDWLLFFNFIAGKYPQFNKPVTEFTLDDLKQISADHFQQFAYYIRQYKKYDDKLQKNILIKNSKAAQLRKLSSVRALFRRLYSQHLLPADPTATIDLPSVGHKEVEGRYLTIDEAAVYMEAVENGTVSVHNDQTGNIEHRSLGKKALEYHKQGGKERDCAMIALFLGTGIRVSELCSLDIDDFDMAKHSFRVIPKGAEDTNAYRYLDYSEEVAEYLSNYLPVREHFLQQSKAAKTNAAKTEETAFFLSRQGKRLTTRQAENIVTKYAKLVAPNKKITPHSLRRSFGMSMYETTQDLYLTSELLGHKDIKTTRDNYTTVTRDRRRDAIKHHRIK